jgi:hypothetical protein
VNLNPILAADLIIFITIVYISSIILLTDLIILYFGMTRFWIRKINIYILDSWRSLIVNSKVLICCGIKFIGQIIVIRSRKVLASVKRTPNLSGRLLRCLVNYMAAYVVLVSAVGYVLWSASASSVKDW